jgi:ubiquinone/menaquinone biosynthesis C-methylase UbiE
MSVVYYSRPADDFSNLYIQARKKEGRFYSPEQIAKLPDIEKGNLHYGEWQLRKKSAMRFIKYLKGKKQPLKILDIGCGNGWFSHLISNVNNTEVIGIDINLPELEQANAVFQKQNLSFGYANLYENTELNQLQFDIIVFNSCFQYFEDVEKIIGILNRMLSENGQIHILDTPFYKMEEVEKAKQRTEKYYQDLGFPDMANYYFHYRLDDLGKHKIMYKPHPSFLRHMKKESPFYWIAIDKR